MVGGVILTVVAGLLFFFLILNPRQPDTGSPTQAAAAVASPRPTDPPAPTSSPPAAPTATTTAPAGAAAVFEDGLYDLALELINESRMAARLSPVRWDPVAAEAARRHTEEMIRHGYFSHWNLEGLGPEHRYTRAGGTHAVMENLHARASVRPPDDWAEVLREAQNGLMDSPGHRANILDPAHTHVGVGMAFDPTSGQFRLAQEFTNQYASLDQWLPLQAERGAQLTLDGRIADAAVDNILLDLAWEPLPQPLSVAELNRTQTYNSAAQSYQTELIEATFNREVVLDLEGRPGIYHIRLFADLGSRQALLLDQSIWVE